MKATASPPIDAAINEIRASDAIVIVGAGASFMAGMPLSGQLAPVVWQVLDRCPAVLQSVSQDVGVTGGSAKSIIGDDPARLNAAFVHVAGHADARREFRQTFSRLNVERTRSISPTHLALARLVHCRAVSHIISLNWDTFLEAAFENRFGIAVNAQQKTLWKPHGDCASPTNDWILPHEPGYVPDELLHVLTALVQDRPRTLVIVGYSERDEVVVQRLISPLAARWRVFRISPGASGEGAIPLSAHEALQEFADALCPNPDVPGCKPVTFANQRGLEVLPSAECVLVPRTSTLARGCRCSTPQLGNWNY